MATVVDYDEMRALALVLQADDQPEHVRQLAQAFLILLKDRCDGGYQRRQDELHKAWMDAALTTVQDVGRPMYSRDEIMRAARENEWPGVSVMMAFNAGAAVGPTDH